MLWLHAGLQSRVVGVRTPSDSPNKMTNSYITVTSGMSGYFAVKMWLNAEDYEFPFWEPYETGVGRYLNKDLAIEEAKAWAIEEELEFKLDD